MSTNGVTVGTLADKHFRRPRCIAAGCKLPAVDGLSYCSEDHYEELVEERKAKQNYRTGYLGVTLPPARPSPVHVAAPKIPTPKPVKQPRPKAKTELSRETLPDEKLRELRALGMSYKDIAREYGQEWAVVASRSQQLGIGASKAAAPEKEMPAQQYEDKEVQAILGQTAQLAKESSDEWRSRQQVALSGSFQSDKQPANPYDLVIADMEKRRDHLLDAIRLMQALRDSGV